VDKIRKILEELDSQGRITAFRGKFRHSVTLQQADDGIQIVFSNCRKQKIKLSQNGQYYRLTSVILKRAEVEKPKERKNEELLPFLWLRNRETNLVAFTLDKDDRLVGIIEQPHETADTDEVMYYLESLAWECDQLEYLLRGMSDFA
jgi:hypothetical protein